MACLVLAIRHGWLVASDEKRRFRREAINRIGADRILRNPAIYVEPYRIKADPQFAAFRQTAAEANTRSIPRIRRTR